MQAIRENQRLVLIGLIVVVLLCLVGALIANRYYGDQGQEVVQQTTATATEMPEEEPTPEPEPSATPTPVLEETPTETPEPTPTEAVADVEEADELQPESTPAEEGADTGAEGAAEPESVTEVVVETIEVTTVDEILKNGSFEDGFAENGVAFNWQSFRTEEAAINFSAETSDPFLANGQFAQRISIDQAWQPDQYGGIYQTVELIAGETYTLTLQGQIRSGFGSVEASSYGYRIQYALDETGGQDWRAITTTDWIELPWPEQSLSAETVAFSDYSTQFTPGSETVTLFLRGWNKWANPGLAEYTLDALSITGPVSELVTVTTVKAVTGTGETAAATPPPSDTTPETEDELIDSPLPVTGVDGDRNLVEDPRFWGAIALLLLLLTGALYRTRWRW
jgi:hypothetical protein